MIVQLVEGEQTTVRKERQRDRRGEEGIPLWFSCSSFKRNHFCELFSTCMLRPLLLTCVSFYSLVDLNLWNEKLKWF